MKKYTIAAIIIAGLLSLYIIYDKWLKPTKTFYLRSLHTGKLIGPVSLPKGHILPQSDEQNYIVAEPTDSELKARNRLLKITVTASLYEVPFSEAVAHTLIVYGIENFRIEVADESKLPLVTVNVKNMPLYEVLCMLAIQTNLRIIIEDGTIIFSEEEFNGHYEQELNDVKRT